MIKIKQTRIKHTSKWRMFEINGVVGSDVIHISYKGKPLFRMEILDSGHINIFEPISGDTNIEISRESNHYSDCDINITDKEKANE